MHAKFLTAFILAAALATPVWAKADFNGIWIAARTDPKAPYQDTKYPSPPPFTDEGRVQSQFWGQPKNNLGARCLPGGGPAGVMSASPLFPLEIIQQDKQVTIIDELMQTIRRVFLDGRKHPAPDDLERSWMGHSVGHWDGEVLVVDTIGVHHGSLNGSGTNVNSVTTAAEPRMPYSEGLHMTERLRLLDGGKYLEDAVTLEDPTLYTRPLQMKHYWRKAPELDMLEYICAETLGDSGVSQATADIPK